MPVVWVVIAVVVLVALIAGAGVSRLRTLSHRVGSFPCAARPVVSPSASWSLGIAHYAVGRIEWWRCWSLAPRPARTWQRELLSVTDREPLDSTGQPGQYLVRCRYDGADFELTISADAYAGLASWLEAAPPGRRDLVV